MQLDTLSMILSHAGNNQIIRVVCIWQIIEKRRRDRINNSLSELRRLVPSAFEKQVSTLRLQSES